MIDQVRFPAADRFWFSKHQILLLGLLGSIVGCGSSSTTSRFEQMAMQRAEANRLAKEDDAREEAERLAAEEAKKQQFGKKSATKEKEQASQRDSQGVNARPNAASGSEDPGLIEARSKDISELAGGRQIDFAVEGEEDELEVPVVHSQPTTRIDDRGNQVNIAPRPIQTLRELEQASLARAGRDDRGRNTGTRVIGTFLSPDGTHLAVVDGNNTIQIIRTTENQQELEIGQRSNPVIDSFLVEDREIRSVAFSADNTSLLVGDDQGGLKSFDITSTTFSEDRFSKLRREARRRAPATAVLNTTITAICESMDGKTVFLGDDLGNLSWRSRSEASDAPPLASPQDPLKRVAVSSDGNRIAAISANAAFLWNGLSGSSIKAEIKPTQVFRSSDVELTAVGFDSRDRLVVGDRQGVLHIAKGAGSQEQAFGRIKVSREPLRSIVAASPRTNEKPSLLVNTDDHQFVVQLPNRFYDSQKLPTGVKSIRRVETERANQIALLSNGSLQRISASNTANIQSIKVPRATQSGLVLDQAIVLAINQNDESKLVFTSLSGSPFASLALEKRVSDLQVDGLGRVIIEGDASVMIVDPPSPTPKRWIDTKAEKIHQIADGQFVVTRGANAVVIDQEGKPVSSPVQVDESITAIGGGDALAIIGTASGRLYRWPARGGKSKPILLETSGAKSNSEIIAVSSTPRGEVWSVDVGGQVFIDGESRPKFGSVTAGLVAFGGGVLTTVRENACVQFDADGNEVRRFDLGEERVLKLAVRSQDAAIAILDESLQLHWSSEDEASLQTMDLSGESWLQKAGRESLIWSDDRMVITRGAGMLIVPSSTPQNRLRYQLRAPVAEAYPGQFPEVIVQTEEGALGRVDIGSLGKAISLQDRLIKTCVVGQDKVAVAFKDGRWELWSLESAALLHQGERDSSLVDLVALPASEAFAWTDEKGVVGIVSGSGESADLTTSPQPLTQLVAEDTGHELSGIDAEGQIYLFSLDDPGSPPRMLGQVSPESSLVGLSRDSLFVIDSSVSEVLQFDVTGWSRRSHVDSNGNGRVTLSLPKLGQVTVEVGDSPRVEINDSDGKTKLEGPLSPKLEEAIASQEGGPLVAVDPAMERFALIAGDQAVIYRIGIGGQNTMEPIDEADLASPILDASFDGSRPALWMITDRGRIMLHRLADSMQVTLSEAAVERVNLGPVPGGSGEAMLCVQTADALVHFVGMTPGSGIIDVVEGVRAPINAFALSPSGRTLAIAFDDDRGSTLIYELDKLVEGEKITRPSMRLTGTAPVTSVEFSPESDKILVGLNNGRMLLRNLANGEVEEQFGASGRIEHLRWNRDQKLVSVHSGLLNIWDMSALGRELDDDEQFSPIRNVRFTGYQDVDFLAADLKVDPLDEARRALVSGAETADVLKLMGVDGEVRNRMKSSINSLVSLQRDRDASAAELSRSRRELTRIQSEMKPFGQSKNLSSFAEGYSNLAFEGSTNFKFDLDAANGPMHVKLNDRYLYVARPTRNPINLRERLFDSNKRFIGFVDHGDNGMLLGFDYRFSRLQTNAWPISGFEVQDLIPLPSNRGVLTAPDGRLFLHQGFSHNLGDIVSLAMSSRPLPQTQWLALGTEGKVGEETEALSIYDASKLGTRQAAPQAQYKAFEGSVTAVAFANRRDQVAFAVRERAAHRIFIADVRTLRVREIESEVQRTPLLELQEDNRFRRSVRSSRAELGAESLIFTPDDKKLIAHISHGGQYHLRRWDLSWDEEGLESFKPSVRQLDPQKAPFYDRRKQVSFRFVSQPIRPELRDASDPLSSTYRSAGARPKAVLQTNRDIRVVDLNTMRPERIIQLPKTQRRNVPAVISEDGHWCMVGDDSGHVVITDLLTGYQFPVTMTSTLEQRVADPEARKRPIEPKPAHAGPVLAIAFGQPDPGQDYPAFAATLGEENKVRVWELYSVLHPEEGLRSRRWTEAIPREKPPEDPEERDRRNRRRR